MKLLYCYKCHDLFKLGYTVRACFCGSSQGAYKEDGDRAWVSGDSFLVLGLRNEDFSDVLQDGQTESMRMFKIRNPDKVEVRP